MGQRGHDLHIGPSYLMRDGLGEPGALELVWRYDILPLLHEHFYGSKAPEAIDQEFGIAALRKRVEARAAVARPRAAEPDRPTSERGGRAGDLMHLRHVSLDELDADGVEAVLERRPGRLRSRRPSLSR